MRWRASCAIFVALISGRLIAQQPDSAARARADSIRADSVQQALRKLAPVVITGTRLSTVDERTPVQMEQVQVQKVIPGPDALPTTLEDLPGVNSFDDFGARLQPELQIRGFTVSPVVGIPQGISVFLDGVRMNEPDAQEVNFDLLPTAAIDNASLVRGSNVLFGRNSLGGTILLNTRRGGDTPEAEIELGAGSFGEQTATVTAGGKLAGIDGFVAATGVNETGWRQATSANTRNIFGTVGYQWGPSHDSGDIAFDFLYGHDKIFEAGSLPLSYIAIDPRINYTPGDFFAPEAYNVTARGNEPIGGGLLRGTLWGRRNNYEQYNANVPPPNTNEFIYNLSGGGTLEWTRPVFLGRIPVGLTFGGEIERDNVHFRLINTGGGVPDSVATLADVRQVNGAFYAQAIVSVTQQMDVTGGVRWDYIRIPFVDDLDATNNGTSTYDRVSPEIGLTYRFTDDLKAYAAYKSGFRAPAPLELACASPSAPCALPSALGADPTLKPVASNDYEGGVDIDVARGTNLDVDAFWTDVQNDIVLASPTLTQVYFVNVPKTRRAGVEASGTVGLPAGLRAFASYSYVAATYQSTIQIATSDTAPKPARPGDIFPTSPLHRGRVGVGISRLLGPLLIDADFDIKAYSGEYLRGDESNQRPEVPGYAVSGLRAHLQYQRYGVELEIDNLFNRQYYTFGIEAANSLGPYGQNNPPANPTVVPFYTPSFPRRVSLALSARL